MNQSPFYRARAMMAAIATAMGLASRADQQLALAEIAPYQSRGKGQGGHQASRNTTAQAKRTASKKRNVLRNRMAHR